MLLKHKPPFVQLACALALGVAAQAHAASNFYCCTDASGKETCGDVLPQTCYSRSYREVGTSGQTRRIIAAPPTAAERKQRAAEEAERKAQEAATLDQKRKDQALLTTYGNVNEIDAMRARASADATRGLNEATQRSTDLRNRRQKLEGSKGKPISPETREAIKDLDLEISAQETIIAARKKELATINQKYDLDKSRYLELNRKAPTPPPE